MIRYVASVDYDVTFKHDGFNNLCSSKCGVKAGHK